MIDDKRIGKRGDYTPETTVTGRAIPARPFTTVSTGYGYYVVLDEDIDSTCPAVDECREIVLVFVEHQQKETEENTDREDIEYGTD